MKLKLLGVLVITMLVSLSCVWADEGDLTVGGKLGVGTDTPTQKLVVRGSATVGHGWDGGVTADSVNFGKPDSAGGFGPGSAFISFLDANFGAGVEYGTGISFTPHQGSAAQAEAMRIAANGNVGIGTTTPTERLEVNGNIYAENGSVKVPRLLITDSNPISSYFRMGHESFIFDSADGWQHDNAGMHFAVRGYGEYGFTFGRTIWPDVLPKADLSNIETLMRIDGNGKVGIGITNPTEKLDVAGNVKANSYLINSSRSYKENIADLEENEALNALNLLKTVTYNLKAETSKIEKSPSLMKQAKIKIKHDKRKYIGFIAEDVPEIVAGPDRKSVNLTDIVAVLVKITRQQQRRINRQGKRIRALEKKLGM